MLDERVGQISTNLDYQRILVHLLVLLAFSFSIFSIYKIFTSITPTLYMLLFNYSFFFILGVIFFYNINKSCTNEDYLIRLTKTSCGIRLQKLACVIFFSLMAIILVGLDNKIYTKEPIYYLLISIASSCLGLQILALDYASKSFRKIILLQILILGIIIRSSSFIINPYLLGTDTYWHYNVINSFIIQQGHLDLYAQYYFYFPSYHLSQAISELIMGQGETSFNLLNLSHSIVSILICYLIGRSLSGEKTGLICALIFSIATPVLTLLISNSSKIGGVTLALFCIYLVINIYKKYDIRLLALLILLALPTAFWHPELLFFLVSLSFANIAVLIYKSNFKVNISTRFLIILFISIISLALYYFYLHFNFSYYVFNNPNKGIPQMISIIPSKNISILFLSQLSISYIGVTFPIFFIPYYLINKQNKMSNYILALLLTLIILHVLPFLSILTGIFALNPERVFNYIQIILLILMANAIINIFDIRKLDHAGLFIIIFFLFTFSSVSTYLIGDGSNIFNDAIPKGTYYLSSSNLMVHDFLSKTDDNMNISGDYETIRYISNPIRGVYNLESHNFAYFPSFKKGYLLLNLENLRRINWEYTDWGRLIIEDSLKNTVYDSRNIKVMYY